jgi:hypothetical protein
MRGTMMAIEKFHLPVHDDHSRKHWTVKPLPDNS